MPDKIILVKRPINQLGNDVRIGGSAGGVLGPTVGGSAGGVIGGGWTGVSGSASGQIQSQARDVVIELRGVVARLLFWTVKETDSIKATLADRGWDIQRVDQVQIGWTPVTERTWLIYARVGEQYSDSDIVTNARNHLSAMMSSVNSVNIVQKSAAGYVSGNYSGSGGNQASGTPPPNASIFGGSGMDAFMGGLGFSSPIALVGGLILLAVIMRR